MSKEVSIYGMYDPREPDHIRYIGKTFNNIKYRLLNHLYCVKDPKSQWNRKHYWIKSLLDVGIKPEITQLFVTDDNNWEVVERVLIQYYKQEGHDLTNKHRGGKLSFYEKNDILYDPITRKEAAKKSVETRRKNGTLARTPESVQQGLETKRNNGTWYNGYDAETNKIRWETRRKNGTDKPTPEQKEKERLTKLKNGSNKPNSGSFGNRKPTPEQREKSKQTVLKKGTNKCVCGKRIYDSTLDAIASTGLPPRTFYNRVKSGKIKFKKLHPSTNIAKNL